MPAFPTTRWSLVLRAAGSQSDEARAALAELCEIYWEPLFRFARREGAAREQAEDEVQDFFMRLLERGGLTGAQAERGRLRSYLLAAFRHDRSNARRRARAVKRGGGERPLQLDVERAERRLADDPASRRLSPERLFERDWARAVLDRAMEVLERQYRDRDREGLFALLRPHLVGDDEAVPYRELARRTELSEGALKVAVHRLRRRYGDTLRAEIAQTLDDPAGVEEELRQLAAILRS